MLPTAEVDGTPLNVGLRFVDTTVVTVSVSVLLAEFVSWLGSAVATVAVTLRGPAGR